MRIGVPAESRPGEARVAATAETVKKLVAAKHSVVVQSGAGVAASQTDAMYTEAGATIGAVADALGAEMVLKVRLADRRGTGADEEGRGAGRHARTVQCRRSRGDERGRTDRVRARGGTAHDARAEHGRAQSSQANIAGYKAVLLAANTYGRLLPMMMTAAGTIKAARVVILGAGVAGLQAIATAKRLGAVIEASDVRPAVKEQIESLGAKFIDVPFETDEEREIAKGVGGYARPMPEAWMKRQAREVAKRIAAADIVITTALIPGRKAPVLVTEEMVTSMKPGSVILDMAVEQGGNCALSELDKTVVKHNVHIIGQPNLPATVPADTSALYARNVLDFIKLVFDKDGAFTVNLEDDIVAACLMCMNGEVLRKSA